MKLHFLLFLVFMMPCSCSGQRDSTYIKPYEHKFSVRTYLAKNFLSMEQQTGTEESKRFMPNNPPNIGLGFSLNNTIVNVSYGQGFNFMREKDKGKTKAFDLQIHNYGKKFIIDVFIQKYRGFYTADDDGNNIELYPDLKIQQYGAYGQYVFNNKKFSYKAAFNQSEKQLKSAGSFLIGGGVYFTKIESDSSFVHKEKNSLRNFQFGVSGGYAYLWAINNKWFASASTTVGINVGSERLNTFGKRKIEAYPTLFPRIAVGYNKEDWSIGLSYVSNAIFSAFSDNKNSNVGLYSGNFKLSYILRLDSFDFFGKKKPEKISDQQ
ncbi:uncharacterized protein DUF4421 [Flavobacterium endophyticum]|uniref:Uncharacterized protein DUF4421 n=1 Tax=Flavobacterium endophyticum TaxID=1540163 RepID=A0A495LZ64_9FLAO|nr:DUF4421 family protein [Flavobacterium endophyticum]RKS18428.1 uncharacterized protein DUF4421 [Flavobacterium endophyticum]